MVLSTEWAQVEVIDLMNDGSGLAFGIIGGRSTGVVVKTILPGGVADRDGRLQSGDHILQIGEVNLRGLGSEQVASVLRQCGIHVRMVVARPVESTSTDYQTLGSHAPIVPTKILGDPVELDKHLIENGFTEVFTHPPSNYTTPYIYSGQEPDLQLHPISGLVDVVKNPLPIGNIQILTQTNNNVSNNPVNMLPLDMALHEPNLPETETYSVELVKDDLGLGITVAGYVCEKEEISGIFVKSISKGSAAALNRKIKVNDRIIEVDGKSVIGQTNHRAVEILRSTGTKVFLKCERYLRGPKYEQLQLAIKANELLPAAPPSPTISSLPKVPLSLVRTSYLGIEPEGESRTSFDFDSAVLLENSPNSDKEEIVFYDTKSVQFSVSSQESVFKKWKDLLNKDVQIVISEMHKEFNGGLGISLEGTVDVEDGKEVRPHHYIRNILADGPVGRSGILQSGDELLEVNGIQLLGLHHLEVVSILKHLPDFVSLVCARYPTPVRIIDTAQRIEAFQSRKILAGSLQTLIHTCNDRLVKAKSETSLASSVASEGCNAESRSRSLEMVAGLPMWSNEHTLIELHKGDHGLGFSILDYQDPLNSQETVIVVRSLVPGGVAQNDGRLIPGDRLIAVNDISVEHANLDKAVQMLKGAPKGLVKILVAKPLSSNDDGSHTSQDTEDDQTCLDDFQECIEEYQECLEVVHICMDDSTNNSFNTSPCTSQIDELGQRCIFGDDDESFHQTTSPPPLKTKNESDGDASFKTLNESAQLIAVDIKNIENKIPDSINGLDKKDSLTQSEKNLKSSTGSDRDDYETCVDESLSEDSNSKIKSKLPSDKSDNILDDNCSKFSIVQTSDYRSFPYADDTFLPEETTPTNSKLNSTDQLNIGVSNRNFAKNNTVSIPACDTVSEPCLSKNMVLSLIKGDDGLKSYDRDPSEHNGPDEFFLVQYPSSPKNCAKEVTKSSSESNVLDSAEITSLKRKLTYRKCLKEYYNDYKDCLELYRQNSSSGRPNRKELSDDKIFNEIYLPFKSKSAPDVMDRSFVMMTYDPGPDRLRRKSAFVSGHQEGKGEVFLQMTVIRPMSNDYGTMKERHITDMLQKHWGSTHSVKVYREPNSSLGISIVGGKVDLQSSEASNEAVLGIFVKTVVPNSPAGKTGEFKTGDRILEVSGTDVQNCNHEEAVEIIRKAPNPVVFLVQSLLPWFENKNSIESDNCQSPFPSPVSSAEQFPFIDEKTIENTLLVNDDIEVDSVSLAMTPEPVTEVVKLEPATTSDQSDEDEDEDDEDDVRYLEGKTVTTSGCQIDRASAANVRRSNEEITADVEEEDAYGYTSNKVKKKYSNLGHSVIMVQLERSNQGLGISLAGHKDRNCMAVFVCGLNPKGAAFKTGGIQVGDEILEVNGVVLHGRCHLNASAIIKGLSGPIFKVIILRRKTAIDDIAVRPITQFPVSLAEEASEEQFSASYPNVRTVSIKKGSQSLGIMIIEGKHAEVGQGIFISDIQEGSAAEKAGLDIGEMILAVNKDSLVGSNYETAANLLKRTEGLVTLVVSNPGKKEAANISANDVNCQNSVAKTNALKISAPPSRPTTPVPEPIADPATCSIVPGFEVTIEIVTDNKGLGVFFVGGKDTPITNGIVIIEVFPGGMADKDSRLQPGDQILDVNAVSLKDVTNTTALQALRQTLPKMKMVVYRPDKIEFTTLDVDLVKKPGKGLGLSIVGRKTGKGVYIADIISGTTADVDGKIMRGDLLVSVAGHNVENSTSDEAGAILKTAPGRVSLKLYRYKPR